MGPVRTPYGMNDYGGYGGGYGGMGMGGGGYGGQPYGGFAPRGGFGGGMMGPRGGGYGGGFNGGGPRGGRGGGGRGGRGNRGGGRGGVGNRGNRGGNGGGGQKRKAEDDVAAGEALSSGVEGQDAKTAKVMTDGADWGAHPIVQQPLEGDAGTEGGKEKSGAGSEWASDSFAGGWS